MNHPLKSERSTSLGLLLARLPMGAFFLIAGIQKVHGGIDNFVAFASTQGSAPRGIPPHWINTYLHSVPYLEIVIGSLLLVGLLGRLSALIGFLMVLSYVIGYTGLHGVSQSDKGLPFHPDLIYLGLLLMLFLLGPGRISLDGVLFGRKRLVAAT